MLFKYKAKLGFSPDIREYAFYNLDREAEQGNRMGKFDQCPVGYVHMN